MKHLKSHQEYIDQYDRLTFTRCREVEESHKNNDHNPIVQQNGEDINLQPLLNAFNEIRLYFLTGQYYEEKEATIRKWEEEDKKRDELYESAQPPENISCLACGRLMFVGTKSFDLGDKDTPDRIMFFFECPLKHLPMRMLYNTGEEYMVKPSLCSKCKSSVNEEHSKTAVGISIKRSCKNCSHIEIEEIDFSVKEKIPDINFAKDRERFCLSEEEGKKFIMGKTSRDNMARLADEWKEKDSKKVLYDKVAQIKKLKIVELEELLAPLFEKNNYVKFHIKDPETGRDLFVPFIVYDADEKREERYSVQNIQRLIKKALNGTNWRLMNEGVKYRLGMLEGRFRAYEREEDLLKLVE